MVERNSTDELDIATISGAIAALEKRAAALREQAALGISVVVGEHGPTTIISSEAAAALRLADDFEEIAHDLRQGQV